MSRYSAIYQHIVLQRSMFFGRQLKVNCVLAFSLNIELTVLFEYGITRLCPQKCKKGLGKSFRKPFVVGILAVLKEKNRFE